MLHTGWQKMNLMKILSIAENKRQQHRADNEHFDVCISNETIFNDLNYVFTHIHGYKKLYLKFFEDMSIFEFDKTSSVTDNKGEYPAKFDQIKLYEHTFNTFREMVLLIKDNNHYEIQKDIFLFIALLHDFGKSYLLCEKYNIDLADSHWVRGAKYFKKIMDSELGIESDMDKTSQQIIYSTIYIHHDLIEKKKENIFLEALKLADSRARTKEELLLGKTI